MTYRSGLWVTLAVAAALAACAKDEEPVGVGRGADKYKESPCSCLEVPQQPPSGADLERYRHLLGGGAT